MVGHATTRPVRLRVHDTTLGCDRLRRIGFAATAAQKRVGPIRRAYDLARMDAREHNEGARTENA